MKFAIGCQVAADTAAERRLVRIEIPFPSVDPFSWLQAQNDRQRMYWRGRHSDDQVAMCGVAMDFSGRERPDYEALTRTAQDLLDRPGAEPRLYGGLRFDVGRVPENDWFGFPSWRLALPRFELHKRESRTLLCCNLVLPEDQAEMADLLGSVDSLCLPAAPELEESFQTPESRTDNPGFEGWKAQVNWAIDAFERDIVEKVVLARRVDFQFDKGLDGPALLASVQKATPNCFHFLMESGSGEAFLGASPERLFFRRGREVVTEAVAGTRPRGETDDDDRAYCAALLASEKDQREHAYVREFIRGVLDQCCESVSADESATEMRLAGGRHLYSRLSGTLGPDVTDFDLLRMLHPTPAVGGHPTSTALEAIESLEDFDRGWYAGPVGWIARDSAEFAVALRCGVVSSNRLVLFSGAGLVEGSEPGSEWLEIEQKITDFTRILGLAVRSAK